MNFKNWLNENEQNIEQIIARFDKEYPRAGREVNGMTVRPQIPNKESIKASLTNYKVLPAVREFPIYGFGGHNSHYDVKGYNKSKSLAEQLKFSKEINPLIIVEEKNGPYILEGQHRMSAMVELKAKLVPALIVIDIESFLE